MHESHPSLAALRGRIAMLAGAAPAEAGRIVTGHGGIDGALGGGLARGRLHEIFAADAGEAGSAAGFAAMLALRARAVEMADGDADVDAHPGEGLLWLRCDEAERRGGGLYAPGLADLGGAADGLLLAVAPDPVALLRGAGDAARCPGLAVVVVECWGDPRVLDLTATRRLTLAAEDSGVPVLLLRIDARASPSAADTRWRVRAAPSRALAANAPGQAAFEVELLRQRSGIADLRWRVEWDRERIVFREAIREPALPGAVVPLPSRGSAAGGATADRRIA
ncbi:MAG: hypothetical protein QHC65_04415 [Sphingomonas sp.]|nr:hypothetical protein [Sphingomonas sp.]MDX3883643.1 hypothetical protein [Sphingomonas sp.]